MALGVRLRGGAAALAIGAALLALYAAIRASGFSGVSGDDFFRALTVFRWSREPSFSASAGTLKAISVLWLPAHFWLGGALYLATGQLVGSLTAISFAASALALWALYRLGETLFDRRTGLLALALGGLLPAFAWLSVAMSEMTGYYAAVLAGFLHLARWERGGRRGALAAAAGLFLLSTLLRPEGWIFAGLFAARVGLRALCAGGPWRPRLALLALAALPLLFVAVWLARNWIDYGSPVHFLRYSRRITQEHAGLGSLPRLFQALNYPFLFVLASPALAALAAAGALAGWRGADRARRQHVGLVAAELLVLMAGAVYGAGTKAFPVRYVLVNVLLLVPFAADLLLRLLARPRARAWGAALLAACLATQGARLFRYPTLYRDVVAAGRALRGERAAPCADGEPGRIASELALRRLAGEGLAAEKGYLVLVSAHVALMVASGDPDAVLFGTDLLAAGEKAALLEAGRAGAAPDPAAARARVERGLRTNGVTAVVVTRRESAAWLPADFVPSELRGTVTVFARAGAAPPALRAAPRAPARWTPVDRELGPGLSLAAAGAAGGAFADALALRWRVGPGVDGAAAAPLRLVFTPAGAPARRFVREIHPLPRWRPPGAAGELEEAVDLWLPPDAPDGRYDVALEFPGSGPAVALPPVVLVSSKREVLVRFLRARPRDGALLARVLLSL